MKGSAYMRIPAWTVIVVSACLCLYLGSQFLRYEDAIARNGDTMAYRTAAITINAIHSGKSVPAPAYYPPLSNIIFLSAENNILGLDRKSTRLNSSHVSESRMPSSA